MSVFSSLCCSQQQENDQGSEGATDTPSKPKVSEYLLDSNFLDYIFKHSVSLCSPLLSASVTQLLDAITLCFWLKWSCSFRKFHAVLIAEPLVTYLIKHFIDMDVLNAQSYV